MDLSEWREEEGKTSKMKRHKDEEKTENGNEVGKIGPMTSRNLNRPVIFKLVIKILICYHQLKLGLSKRKRRKNNKKGVCLVALYINVKELDCGRMKQ